MKIASMLLIIALTLLVYNASGRRLPDSPRQWTLAFLIVSCAGMLLGMSLSDGRILSRPLGFLYWQILRLGCWCLCCRFG